MKLSELIWDEASNFGGDKNGLAQAITARLHECVKPLEWATYCSKSGNCAAQTPFGEYVVEAMSDEEYGVWSPTDQLLASEPDIGVFNHISPAKAAAQAHYAKQIIAGLDL